MKLPTSVRIRLWPMIAVMAALTLIGILFANQEEKPLQVQTVSPSYRDLTSTLSTNGKVTPMNAFEARAAFAGMVESIYVKVGDKVLPGQKIVQLKDPYAPSRYTSAMAGLQGALVAEDNFRHQGSQEDRINFAGDLKRAEAEQADAASRLDLLKQLTAKGDASEAELSDAERRLQAANTALQTDKERMTERYSQKDLSSASARVADARANVETARQVLANANMTSTIAGTVYSIPVSPYDYVPMGADLVLIANLDAVQIRAYFDEPDIGQLHAGEPVDVIWDARPGVTWRGHVEQPPLTVSPMGVRMVGQCIITVDNSNGQLLPNTDVSVRVETAKHFHVLSVPRQALHTEGTSHFVFCVVNGKLVRTAVTPGIVNLQFAEIRSGLTTNDVLVVEATNGTPLSHGQRVQASH